MKYTIASLVALACASSSFAVTLGTAPAVTIALTASSTAGGFKFVDPETGEIQYVASKSTEGKPDKNGYVVTTTETKTVVQTYKAGNAEILKGLYDDGQLPDSNIKGWTIVAVRALDEGSAQDGLYAVKKGQPAILIQEADSETGNLLSFKALISNKAGKETSSTNPDVAPAKISYSDSGKAVFGFSYENLDIQGVVTYSFKYAKGTFGKGNSALPYEIDALSGGIKSTGISGTFPVVDEEGNQLEDENGNPVNGIVEGSLSVAAETVLDLDVTLGSNL